jgi:hypothetical protein
VPVAHAYNPSYSGGKDQEDHIVKHSPGRHCSRPYLEKPYHKNWACGVAHMEGPEFKLQYWKKKVLRDLYPRSFILQTAFLLWQNSSQMAACPHLSQYPIRNM